MMTIQLVYISDGFIETVTLSGVSVRDMLESWGEGLERDRSVLTLGYVRSNKFHRLGIRGTSHLEYQKN